MRDGLSIARESTSACKQSPAGDESILKEPVLWVLTIYHTPAGSDKVRRKGVARDHPWCAGHCFCEFRALLSLYTQQDIEVLR